MNKKYRPALGAAIEFVCMEVLPCGWSAGLETRHSGRGAFGIPGVGRGWEMDGMDWMDLMDQGRGCEGGEVGN